MTKVTIEYDDSELLGCMFRDAIAHCLMMKMDLMARTERAKATMSEEEKLLDNHMLEFYDDKVEAYEKMRDSMTWDNEK
jgi:hypothetical protein